MADTTLVAIYIPEILRTASVTRHDADWSSYIYVTNRPTARLGPHQATPNIFRILLRFSERRPSHISVSSPPNVCKRLDDSPIIFASNTTVSSVLSTVSFARMASHYLMLLMLRRLANFYLQHSRASLAIKLLHSSATCSLALSARRFVDSILVSALGVLSQLRPWCLYQSSTKLCLWR